MNQIWTPPLVGSDWLIHSLTARSVSLLDLDLDYTDSNEVSEFISSGPRLHYALQTDGNSINACDIVAYIQTIYSQRIRQFTTSISTQHVERAGIQTYPADWCCLTDYQHDSASEHDSGGHNGQGERTGAPWAKVPHIHQPTGVKGLKHTSHNNISHSKPTEIYV